MSICSSQVNHLLIQYQLFDLSNNVSSYMPISTEKTFGVETDSVCIDFSKGESVYGQVEQRLIGKDIGILGELVILFQ